jgi:hypothetical protein
MTVRYSYQKKNLPQISQISQIFFLFLMSVKSVAKIKHDYKLSIVILRNKV